MVCDKTKLKVSCEKNRIDDIDEESLTVGVLVFAFDFESNVTLLRYLRDAEHTESLHRHRVKVKRSFLPAGTVR